METGVWSASFNTPAEQKVALTVKGTASKEFLETTTKKAKVETESKGEAIVLGGHQVETMGLVSYPIPIEPGKELTAIYRNQTQSGEPESPCNGGIDEPVAEEGFLCVYTGEQFGEKESEWSTTSEFFGFQDPSGKTTSGQEKKGGIVGESIVFRSKEFNEEEPKANIKKGAYLNTGGSWAATAR